MKLLNYFKKKEEPLVPFDYSILVNDVHSHLIPGIDDGSPSMEESIKLIKGLVEIGYKKLVTTPHVMSDYYRNSTTDITNGLEQLRKAVELANIDVIIEASAEYYMDYEFSNKVANRDLLAFGDNYLLVECSFVDPPRNLEHIIFEIQVNGYKPVLAHPERYLYWNGNHDIFHQLKERDVLFQLNLLSLTGIYSPPVEQTARYLIDQKMYNFIGSDLHHDKHLALMKNLQIGESLLEKIKQLNLLNTKL